MSAPASNPRKPVDDPLFAVIEPAVKVGLFSGGAGFLVGGTAGILKGTTPTLFALASSIQCGALGSSFWASRGLILQAWDTGNLTPSDRTKASALAGGLSGGTAGLIFRGRSNAIPGALAMAFFGFAGQAIHNKWTATPAPAKPEQPKKGFWQSMTSLGLISHLSNDEYAEMLKERLFKVDVEIAVLDDKIAALKKHQAEQAAEKQEPEK
ncbi:hypothetical protein Q7P37_001586 [Cladosporium fusiforme]